jgi:hypothetical protein
VNITKKKQTHRYREQISITSGEGEGGTLAFHYLTWKCSVISAPSLGGE